jgi:hypothetical protein
MVGESSPQYPFHLCQPGPEKSCGACCGLYNWEDHSRATLESLLQRRTSLFFSLGENPDLNQYRSLSEGPPANRKLLETIYNCEFLGFIDKERKRAGCLLHPAIHQGVDRRGRSFYGAELCAGHFCPSFTHLTTVEQIAVLATLDDWYLYGLVITDIDLIKDFFKHVQNRLGESLCPNRLADLGVCQALRDFFRLKEFWRFASSKTRLGKYYFSHSEYQIARIEYEKNWKIRPSNFDKILVSLSSEFGSKEDILEAESMIEEKIEKFVEAYQCTSP